MAEKVKKTEFINYLLNYSTKKEVDNNTRTRLFNLLSKEVGKSNNIDGEIIKRIEKLEGIIKLDRLKNTVKEKTKPKEKSGLNEYEDPKIISQFLLEYNQDLVLKTTTHLIDVNDKIDLLKVLKITNYDFKKHHKEIENRFYKLTQNTKINKNLFSKILAYLKGGKQWQWSENKITQNWNSEELIKWTKDNPNKIPSPDNIPNEESFAFSENIPLNSGEKLSDFNDLVLHFKKQVTIRHDNNLQDLCRVWSFKFAEYIELNIDNIQTNIQIFTDVEKLGQAFKNILKMCISVSKKDTKRAIIHLGLKEEGNDKIIFSIHHKNTIFKNTANGINTRYGKDFTNIINKNINGVCDWELIADFGNDDYQKIQLWPKKEGVKIDKVVGATFNLIFHR